MRWLVLITGIVLVVAGLYPRWRDPANGPLTLAPAAATLRNTDLGPVIGGFSPNGAQVWLGIPYAAPPTGALRWRAPQAAQGWVAPRESLSFSSACPQLASRLSATETAPGTLTGSEDCLYLNVFTPSGLDAQAELPVMVFVHGGGNTIGSAIPYDASILAQEQGLVVVTLNYRLGFLGWFSHRALRDQSLGPEDASGNFGLLDIVAALRWVQRNAPAFGGDPSRVTVFGESAGGRNIYALLATPSAKGLFQGAIIQSGFPGTFPLALAENAATDTEPGHPNSSHELVAAWLGKKPAGGPGDARRAAAQRLSRELLDHLRSLDLDQLFAGVVREGNAYAAPTLMRDGAVLPRSPLPTFFENSDAWNRVPLLVGSNRDEMKLFLVLSERHTAMRFGVVPTPRNPASYDALARHHSRAWKAAGVDLPLSVMSRDDSDLRLYAYRFDWDDTLDNFLISLPEVLGAAHAMELDFLFQPLLSRVVPGVALARNRDGRQTLGRTMRDYWAGFAYNLHPGAGRSGTRPARPRWSEQNPRVMLFDEANDGGVRFKTFGVAVDDVKAELALDETLSERLRCALYADLYLFNTGLPELFDPGEYQALGCGSFPTSELRNLSR